MSPNHPTDDPLPIVLAFRNETKGQSLPPEKWAMSEDLSKPQPIPTPEPAPAPDPAPLAAAITHVLEHDDPFAKLLPYQKTYVEDTARFKYALQARQTGKDYAAAAEGISDCYHQAKLGRKTTWLIAAPSERQSLESLAKWKEWAEWFNLLVKDADETRENPGNSQSLMSRSSIVFENGSRVIAVPGKPDTVRGFSANVLLTEFAFFDDPDKTWRAIFPSITNPLRGAPKKCRLVTTPNGAGNKAHELWRKNFGVPNAGWSCHRIDIYDAVAKGLPIDIAQLRAGLDDAEGWAQEYELNFLDQATVLLPYETIVPCENALALETAPLEFWHGSPASNAPLFLGIDFGRKRDLTVCWALELMGNQFRMTREVLTLSNAPTPQQLEALRPRLRKAQRVCFDYTGPGVGLGDLLVQEFGEYHPQKNQFGKIELCTFTNQLKVDIFPKLRMAFDQKTIAIPISRAVREDLHSVSRVILAGGGVTYRAPHTDDGHADRCTALALALRATTHALSVEPKIYIFENTRLSQILTQKADRSIEG